MTISSEITNYAKREEMEKIQQLCGEIVEVIKSVRERRVVKVTTTATRSELSRREVKKIMGRFADLTGKKFGRLCVVGLAERDKHNRIRWICKCDCGNRIIVSSSHLNSGHTQSGGCLQRERTSEVCKKIWKVGCKGTNK